jgi:hypothetical protein
LDLELARLLRGGSLCRFRFAGACVGDDAVALDFGLLDLFTRLRFRNALARDVRVALRNVSAVLDERKRPAFLDGGVGGCKRVACGSKLLRCDSACKRLARDCVNRLSGLLERLDAVGQTAATDRGDRKKSGRCSSGNS